MNKFPNQTWNNTREKYPSNKTIHSLMEDQVARTPEAPALVYRENVLSFEKLNAEANKLANTFRHLGLATGDIVACHLRCPSLVVLYILAILKAGGAYLLLDPSLPEEKLLYLVKNAEPSLIITDTFLPEGAIGELATLSHFDLQIYHTKEMAEKSKGESKDNLDIPIDSEACAYLAYTSGSTGKPKGVLISHRSSINHAYFFAKMFNFKSDDCVPLIASISFDVAIEEMLPPLISGCRMVSLNPTYESMEKFNEEIEKNRCTILNLPAPLWHSWSHYLYINHLPIPKGIRLVIVGSDKIYTKHYYEWCQLEGADKVHWVGAYGTTETAVSSTFYLTAKDDDLEGEPLMPIGKPIANTFIYVLDDDHNPLPPNEVGELYIGGEGVGIGYHMLPAATASKFLSDPFSDVPNARMYATGDFGRYRPDGNFVCIGRRDLQIKINGLRFELGDIEATLNHHPAVKRSYVVMSQNDNEEESKKFVAFISLKDKHKDDDLEVVKSELYAFANEKLHRYVRPTSFIIMEHLPLMASGKVDRGQLEKIASGV